MSIPNLMVLLNLRLETEPFRFEGAFRGNILLSTGLGRNGFAESAVELQASEGLVIQLDRYFGRD